MIIGWRAWYGDGAVFDSHEVNPYQLPRTGLVGIMEYEDVQWAPGRHYKRIVKNGDWYWWDDSRWQRILTGEWETWAPCPSMIRDIVIQSTSRLSDHVYNQIIAAMMDSEWP